MFSLDGRIALVTGSAQGLGNQIARGMYEAGAKIVLGDISHAEASECESPAKSDEILSYADKYTSGGGGKKGGKTVYEEF